MKYLKGAKMFLYKINVWIIIGLFLCFKSNTCIKCYKCKSHDDSRCKDPFNNQTKEINPCIPNNGLYQNGNAQYCIKTVQTTEDDRRIIRDCAWLGPDQDFDKKGIDINEYVNNKCYKMTGTYRVSRITCYCNDRDGCNGASNLKALQTLCIFAIFIASYMLIL
ncbi:unnamed protein product [Gordionus sp. m RMFG-2023]|uniref:UPAR/Ly6 domain-containing protein crok-like n=1 Tax=Gordionus sp. m RMFG-2023 TaxID=3053472 RepID=UPI0030E3D805